MPSFSAPDGTELAYHLSGQGSPVICLPGGTQDAGYLGDLGGLSAHRRLVLHDPRGTGRSATPADPASYRCDRLVRDVEALREHLGLDRIDLLAHCAGANLALLYAVRHPERVARLALITPSTVAVALAPTGRERLEAARLRADEPWFGPAYTALEAIVAGDGDDWEAVDPFFYGRWDARAQAHLAAQEGRRNAEAAAVFAVEGAFDPEAIRAALGSLPAPALVLAGELDLNSLPGVVAGLAALLPGAEYVVQPGAGHYPWLDDPGRFTATVAAFLTGCSG
ncbi:alpha/beta fold hydrolase [Nonomuraea aridisoli]|uniref:Alpha/beta hydrolase n=1 Tax=Nonomuraea aridisoli TaxID=2070368 RepID=A0A2W2EFE7_9ACTN|nr:alpha/beta hydrolase [Nonomuraea aridisoli]PZG21133.1 alpha/beta hydrolase [Nonomuraea aridisoli]